MQENQCHVTNMKFQTVLVPTRAEANIHVTSYNPSPAGFYTPISNIKERPDQNSELLGKHLNFERKGKPTIPFVVTWSFFFKTADCVYVQSYFLSLCLVGPILESRS